MGRHRFGPDSFSVEEELDHHWRWTKEPSFRVHRQSALRARVGREEIETGVLIDGTRLDSPTHQIDCFKNKVALEIEWNNKDPFFDRDLNNFRLLFDLRAVSVGVIVTRCDELQQIFKDIGKGSSYGASTTHMSKLLPKVEGGGAAGCPLLVFGISKTLYQEDEE